VQHSPSAVVLGGRVWLEAHLSSIDRWHLGLVYEKSENGSTSFLTGILEPQHARNNSRKFSGAWPRSSVILLEKSGLIRDMSHVNSPKVDGGCKHRLKKCHPKDDLLYQVIGISLPDNFVMTKA